MSESLSEAEIEALLNTLGTGEEVAPGGPTIALPSTPLGGEDLALFSSKQAEIWTTVSTSVSEDAERDLVFGNPLTVSVNATELFAAFPEPVVMIEFGFNALPESVQVVVIPPETALALAGSISGSPREELDENTVAEIRSALEGIIQGICISVSQATNEIHTATGLTFHTAQFTLPEKMPPSDIVRTQVSVTGDGVDGTAVWLIDAATARFMLGKKQPVAEASTSRQNVGPLGGAKVQQFADNASNVERLLDIPLEIDVELARIKMLFKDVAELGNGSIVEIEKTAGELVDILVGGRIVARGEVVVVDDCFGVRISEILSPRDRLVRQIATA